MINRKTLPKDIQEMLDNLLNKSPADLTPDEIGFLKARRDYLNETEIKSIPKIEEVVEVKEKPPIIKWKPKDLK